MNLNNFKGCVLFIFSLILMSAQGSDAQITRTVGTTGADYSTIKGAFDAINSGSITGSISLQIIDNTTEGASAVLNASGTGSASYTSINIYPTVSGKTISGNINAPLIDLNGADNVIIDGRINASGTSKDLVISNTSNSGNSGTSTIRFYSGACNNTVKYCTIKGSTTDGSGGVIFFSATSANTGNTIDNNNITNASDTYRPVNTIYSGGAANTVTISNNYFYDFLSRISTSYGINLNTSTGASTISGNSFYETNTFSPTSNRIYYYPIYINSTTTGFLISGNYIGGSAPLCTGTWTKTNSNYSSLYAINLNSVGTGTPSVVKGNTINNIVWNNNNNDNSWSSAIYINAGDVTLGANGEPNTIGSLTGTPNYSITNDNNGSVFAPIVLNGSGYITCQYNNIGGITVNNTNTTQVTRLYCIYRGNSNTNGLISNNTIGSAACPISTASPATGDVQYLVGIYNNSSAATGLTLNNNTISYLNNMTTGSTAGYVCGIHSYDAPAILTISNNNIHDLTIANSNEGSGRNASIKGGIFVTSGSLLTVTNNTIYNLTNTHSTFRGFIYGINCAAGTGANDCSGNTVYNLTTTGTGSGPSMYGIYFNAGFGAENTIKRNYVYDLSSAGVTGNSSYSKYYGIYKVNNCIATLANNIISLGGNTMSTIYGIYDEGGSGRNTNVYFNTVYIHGSPTEGNLWSYVLYSANNNARTYKNNVLYNARSNNGASGTHFCIYYGTTPSATSDYNDLYAPGSGGYIGFYNGNYCTTLPAFRTATSQEANSLNTDPIFVNGYRTAATLNGVSGTGITTDYYGATRSEPPRMGAIDSVGVITYTWTGATSSAFNVSTNWQLNYVPPDGAEISFDASPVNNCVLDQNRTLGNITNASGKDLVLNGFQLTLLTTTEFTSTGKIDASASGSTVLYSGSSAQTFSSGLFKNNTVYNLTLNNSNGLTQNGDLTVLNNLTLTLGALAIGVNTLSLNGDITYTSGSLTGGSSSNITFGGSGASTNLAGISLNNLTLNRANGINLTGDITINNSLTLSNGLLNTGSNIITFSTTATNPAETSGSRIVGTARIMNIPVGTGACDFLGFKINSGVDDIGYVTLIRKTGTAGIITVDMNSSIACNWDVTTDCQPVGGRNIEYRWLSDLDNGKAFETYNKGVNYFSTNGGTNWIELGEHLDVSTSNPRVMSLTTTHFSQWVSTSENSPLPVTLSFFTSSVSGRNIKLNWITVSELNNTGFEIERTIVNKGAPVYQKAGYISGKGTTSTATNYTFEDRNLNTGKYQYRLKQIDNNGNYEYHNLSGVVEVGVPGKYDLSQNYPNPFNPKTKINFDLPYDSKVSVIVYDMTGREIKTLVNEMRTAGFYTVIFDASDISSGIYFYRIIANANGKDFICTKKLALIK
jgi:hypothetical protein